MKKWPLGCVAGMVGAFVGACAAGGHFNPPPVAGPVAESGTSLGFSETLLASGRDVYATRCGSCHSLVPPQSRTREQWETILPRMSRKARLEPDEGAAVRAYILAAHRAAGAP